MRRPVRDGERPPSNLRGLPRPPALSHRVRYRPPSPLPAINDPRRQLRLVAVQQPADAAAPGDVFDDVLDELLPGDEDGGTACGVAGFGSTRGRTARRISAAKRRTPNCRSKDGQTIALPSRPDLTTMPLDDGAVGGFIRNRRRRCWMTCLAISRTHFRARRRPTSAAARRFEPTSEDLPPRVPSASASGREETFAYRPE